MALRMARAGDHVEHADRFEPELGAGCRCGTRNTYRPAQYFLLTYALTWIPWVVAAYCSYRAGMAVYSNVSFFLGGFGPFASALILTWEPTHESLKLDFLDRLVNLRRFSAPYVAVTLLLSPFIACMSVAISMCFGRPAGQLTLLPAVLTWVPLMFVGPALEELWWRGYGVDALRSRLGEFNASVLFGVLWAVWHVPLFLINHSYQHDLWLMNPIYAINFFVSHIPLAIVANWLYYKHNRLIPAAILFHCMYDAVAESLNIEQFTKCIITAIYIAFALGVALIDRRAFRAGPRIFIP